MEEKSEWPDLRAERRAGVMATGRKCQHARLTHTGLPPPAHGPSAVPASMVSRRCHANCDEWRQMNLLISLDLPRLRQIVIKLVSRLFGTVATTWTLTGAIGDTFGSFTDQRL